MSKIAGFPGQSNALCQVSIKLRVSMMILSSAGKQPPVSGSYHIILSHSPEQEKGEQMECSPSYVDFSVKYHITIGEPET
jgi:hypothetical protein